MPGTYYQLNWYDIYQTIIFLIVNASKRTSSMLAKDDYGENPREKLHKDAHGAKEMQLYLSQHSLIVMI